jgi:hypothetical protein
MTVTTLQVSDKAQAAMQTRKIARMEQDIQELVGALNDAIKRIEKLENKGAK